MKAYRFDNVKFNELDCGSLYVVKADSETDREALVFYLASEKGLPTERGDLITWGKVTYVGKMSN